MTGQYPLDQRRSGPWQTHYENRLRLAKALGTGRKPAPALRTDGAVDVRNLRLCIVIDRGAVEFVCGGDMLEGSAILADIFIFLAQRKTQQYFIGGQELLLAKNRFYFGDIISIWGRNPQIRTQKMRQAITRVYRDRVIAVLFGGFELPQHAFGGGKVE